MHDASTVQRSHRRSAVSETEDKRSVSSFVMGFTTFQAGGTIPPNSRNSGDSNDFYWASAKTAQSNLRDGIS
jgi:hypothetical protein